MGSDRWVGEAPAKVNLRLEVLAREESGYHQIETEFHRIALADRVTIALSRRGDPEHGSTRSQGAGVQVGSGAVTLRLVGVPEGALGPVDENLAVMAAHRFGRQLQAAGLTVPPVSIRLEKRIPHGAGLGGGSSDAAAVLRGMNLLTGEPFAPDELLLMGAELGADVPFFVSGVPRALAWGRGDRMLPLPPLPEREVVLAVPTEGIATAWAYEVLAAHRRSEGWPPSRPTLHRLAPGEGWMEVAGAAQNDFEAVLFRRRPELQRIKETLARSGARPALLSGSGSAVFGVFEAPEDAVHATGSLEDELPGVRVIRTRSGSSLGPR